MDIPVDQSLASLIALRNKLHKEDNFEEAQKVQDKINKWGRASGKVYRIV